MTAFNLSLCIAPSLLWPKGINDPLATPPTLFQYMIENFVQLFGEDSINLFGDLVEQKMRQDSSTDSDSMHSVLSSHGKFSQLCEKLSNFICFLPLFILINTMYSFSTGKSKQ